MTTTAPATRAEALVAGYLEVGVFGYGSRDAGRVYALPADLAAARAAYDAIDDDDLSDAALEATRAAGGVYVSDRPAAE